MTNQGHIVNDKTAPLQNMALLQDLAEQLINRKPNMPGFGVFCGPSGFGKTFASAYVQNSLNATYIEVGESWRAKKLITAILQELGVQKPKGTLSDLTEQAIYLLSDNPNRPLIIDEADKLVDKKLIEHVREIQDASQAPVILIGEELLFSKLEKFERVHNRVLAWVGAEPCDFADTKALAKVYAPNIEIADDLLAHICDQTNGRARRIAVSLNSVFEFCRNHGTEYIDLTNYDGNISTGQPPKPRRLGR